MNQSALKYSSTLAVVTIASETYAAFFHNQGFWRITTGTAQALVFFGLSYWLFSLGLKRYQGAQPKTKGLIMGGVLCWSISYQTFRLLHSSLGVNVLILIVPVVVGAISYFLGSKGGFAQKAEENEIANK